MTLAAGVAFLCVPSAAGAAPGRDYGDAPDGQPAQYLPDASQLGRFPSGRASGGPSHPANGRGLILGLRSTGERRPRQLDGDRQDDGLMVRRLRACSRRSEALAYVNARRLSRRFFRRRSRARIYVNAWFDWNHDGDFTDGSDGCAPEWAIQNLGLRPRELGRDRARRVAIRFRAGRSVDELWARITLTLGEKARHAGGRGAAKGGKAVSHRFGETEDYLLRPPVSARPIAGGAGIRSLSAGAPGRRVHAASHSGPPVLGGFSGDLVAKCGLAPAYGTQIMDHSTDFGFLPFDFDHIVNSPPFVAPFLPSVVPVITAELLSPKRTSNYQLGNIEYRFQGSFFGTLPSHIPFTYLGRTHQPAPDETIRIFVRFRQAGRSATAECLVVVEHGPGLGETARQPESDDASGDSDPPPPSSPDDRPAPARRQCSDGEDNDGDGRIDHPDDPGCENAGDDSELGEPQCIDGFDNDGDGKIDHPADPGCESTADDSEVDPPPSFNCNSSASIFTVPPGDPNFEEGAQKYRVQGACNGGFDRIDYVPLDGMVFSGPFRIFHISTCDVIEMTKVSCLKQGDKRADPELGGDFTTTPGPAPGSRMEVTTYSDGQTFKQNVAICGGTCGPVVDRAGVALGLAPLLGAWRPAPSG